MAYIPSPSVNGFHLGPLFIHYYGLMYVIGITLAILITQRRWKAVGGDPSLVGDVALWAVPAGIIGGRIYFDITTPKYIPHHWYGIFAVWDGGLGIWGGVALGAVAGIWRVRRSGANWALFADAVAPALLVAQAIGRIGNYFNKELFGGPTSLPWGLYIPPADRPSGYFGFTTFQPTFLYELIFDLALAAALVWLGHHRKIRPPGLFALYVTGYSAFRIFEESLRVDPSVHIFGLRLNMYVAIILALIGAFWFWRSQRRDGPEPALADAAAGTEPEVTTAEEITAESGTPGTPGTPDASPADSGTADTSVPDSGPPDTSTPDAEPADASTPDTSTPDTEPADVDRADSGTAVPAEVGADRSGGPAETIAPAGSADHTA
jgi:prolipoprotein diacylglyceryl transferase